MKFDAGWLISVIGLGIAMSSLWMLSRARTLWARDAAELRDEVQRIQAACGTEVTQMRESLGSIESGMVNAQASLRDSRLNLSVRAQALQMLRAGAQPEALASSLGMTLSEARLLTRVGKILSPRPESAARG